MQLDEIAAIRQKVLGAWDQQFIDVLEERLGTSLPTEVADFYRKTGGCHLERTLTLPQQHPGNVFVDIFCSPAEDPSGFHLITLRDWMEETGRYSQNVDPAYLLFAMDWGGNGLCLDLRDGQEQQVISFDHEMLPMEPEHVLEGNEGFVPTGLTFNAFIANLELAPEYVPPQPLNRKAGWLEGLLSTFRR